MFNLYEKFVSLLPSDSVKVGVGLTSYGDGTALLSVAGGGNVRVYRNGISVISGQNYFFKASGIVALAPTLTTIEVSI